MNLEVAGFKVNNWLLEHHYYSRPENAVLLEQLAEELVGASMANLVKCFFDQVDQERATDYLFEMWFGRVLLHQAGIS